MRAKNTPKTPLTDKQRAMFNWMVEYTKEHFYQPSVREVAEYFGLKSPRSVTGYLQAMQQKGLIRISSDGSGGKAGCRARCLEFCRREPITDTDT